MTVSAADVLGWTDKRVDVSALERTRWLGRVQADPSEHGAFTRTKDEPTDREEREATP
jgi:hypothetical protein